MPASPTRSLFWITHPEVTVDPARAVARWHLSPRGIARMRAFASTPMLADVAEIWSSTEKKAIEAAGLLAASRGLGVKVCAALRENDRSATGFLPPAEFEQVADVFFAESQRSVRGWERAVDAQARVVQAVRQIVAGSGEGDLAIVAHGAVGTLLFCALSGQPISRSFDQPYQGHFWRATLPDLHIDAGWRSIDA